MRKFQLFVLPFLAVFSLALPALATTADETKLSFGCIGGMPALKMEVKFGVNRIEVGIWGNTLANLKNGQKVTFSATDTKESSLNLCMFDSPCLLVSGRLMPLDYRPGYMMNAVASWAVDSNAPPVVLPFVAQIPLKEVKPMTCAPAQ